MVNCCLDAQGCPGISKHVKGCYSTILRLPTSIEICGTVFPLCRQVQEKCAAKEKAWEKRQETRADEMQVRTVVLRSSCLLLVFAFYSSQCRQETQVWISCLKTATTVMTSAAMEQRRKSFLAEFHRCSLSFSAKYLYLVEYGKPYLLKKNASFHSFIASGRTP